MKDIIDRTSLVAWLLRRFLCRCQNENREFQNPSVLIIERASTLLTIPFSLYSGHSLFYLPRTGLIVASKREGDIMGTTHPKVERL